MPNIPTIIESVCQSQSIRCLHAIESGSRAWGFASPDSDYDVRIIYCHQPDWYLKLYTGKDTFEFIQNDLLDVPFDIGGWDIRKALQHLYKSNAVLLEWINSLVVYHHDTWLFGRLHEIQHQFFNQRTCFYHYQGMAKNAAQALYLDKPIKLKKWFYVLHALFASIWVLERQSIAPVAFTQMLELVSPICQEQILDIIALKTTQHESYHHQLSPELQILTKALWQRCDETLLSPRPQVDISILDEIFRQVIFNEP